MRILLLEDQSEELREKIGFALEGSFGALVEHCVNTKEVLKKLSLPDAKYDFLVCDLNKQSGLAQEIFQEKIDSVPIILCADQAITRAPPVGWNVLGIVDRKQLIPNLIALIASLQKKGVLHSDGVRDDYCKIKTKLLLPVVPLRGNIYIRLSDTHFVKLFRQGDQFEASDLQKYTAKKGIEYLFIHKSEIQEFIEKYNADLEKYLKPGQNLGMVEVNAVNQDVFEAVQEMGKTLGFTRDVQVLAKTQIRMTMRAMGKNPRLSDVLGKLTHFEGHYLSTHSTLTAYLSCAIASHLEWGSEATFHKLTLAAFLHDITLEDESIARCMSVEEFEKGGFSEAQRQAFLKHTISAAEIAKTFHEVPPDVDSVILQHHEQPDGSGFPRKLKHSYIGPLSAVFIVAHEIAHRTIVDKQMTVAAMLKEFEEKYSASRFRVILDAVRAVVH